PLDSSGHAPLASLTGKDSRPGAMFPHRGLDQINSPWRWWSCAPRSCASQSCSRSNAAHLGVSRHEKKPPGRQEPPGAPREETSSSGIKSRLLADLAFFWRPGGFFSSPRRFTALALSERHWLYDRSRTLIYGVARTQVTSVRGHRSFSPCAGALGSRHGERQAAHL